MNILDSLEKTPDVIICLNDRTSESVYQCIVDKNLVGKTTILGYYLEGSCGWNGMIVTVMNMLLNFVTEYLYDRFVVFGKTIDTNSRAQAQSRSEGKK